MSIRNFLFCHCVILINYLLCIAQCSKKKVGENQSEEVDITALKNRIVICTEIGNVLLYGYCDFFSHCFLVAFLKSYILNLPKEFFENQSEEVDGTALKKRIVMYFKSFWAVNPSLKMAL